MIPFTDKPECPKCGSNWITKRYISMYGEECLKCVCDGCAHDWAMACKDTADTPTPPATGRGET